MTKKYVAVEDLMKWLDEQSKTEKGLLKFRQGAGEVKTFVGVYTEFFGGSQ